MKNKNDYWGWDNNEEKKDSKGKKSIWNFWGGLTSFRFYLYLAIIIVWLLYEFGVLERYR